MYGITLNVLVSLVFGVLMLSGCKMRAPELRKVSNIRGLDIDGTRLKLVLDAEVFNPNRKTLRAKSFKFDVFIEDKQLGTATSTEPIILQGKAISKLPVSTEVRLVQLARLIPAAVFKDSLKVRVNGHLTFGLMVKDLTLNPAFSTVLVPKEEIKKLLKKD